MKRTRLDTIPTADELFAVLKTGSTPSSTRSLMIQAAMEAFEREQRVLTHNETRMFAHGVFVGLTLAQMRHMDATEPIADMIGVHLHGLDDLTESELVPILRLMTFDIRIDGAVFRKFRMISNRQPGTFWFNFKLRPAPPIADDPERMACAISLRKSRDAVNIARINYVMERVSFHGRAVIGSLMWTFGGENTGSARHMLQNFPTGPTLQ